MATSPSHSPLRDRGQRHSREGNDPAAAIANNSSYNDHHKTNSDDTSLPPPNTHGEPGKVLRIGKLEIPGIKRAGESGRRGFHPWHFLRIGFRSTSRASTICNLLWPIVPAALAVQYAVNGHDTLKFALDYVAMVPCANLVGFAGQELARKLPHVAGVLTEITCGSIVEIVLFMVLLKGNAANNIEIIQAAILGSILANMLLCLGLCFFVGGFQRTEQSFNEAISETGSGLLLTAGVALAIPTVFANGVPTDLLTAIEREDRALTLSRILSILLLLSYCVYVFFQVRSHHGIYDAIFEYDEHRDNDKEKDAKKAKFTMTECAIGMAISVALVTIIAVNLVKQIEPVIEESGVPDAFMGLILVPLVEKFAEHLTAIDEAWDNQMNFALSHVLGATLQTALFNAPLTVLVGWGLDKKMNLNFDVFNLVMLILSILTVGRFLQDRKSNYLEGFLLVILYTAIAASSYYYPNPPLHEGGGEGTHEGGGEEGAETASHRFRL